jgi:hypothetical protein
MSKTGYVEIASCLVTIARSCFSFLTIHITRRLPQARSNCHVTSFRSKQISQNFIVGTDGPTDRRTDGRTNAVSYRGATLLQEKSISIRVMVLL